MQIPAPLFWHHVDRRADDLWGGGGGNNNNNNNNNNNSMQAAANVIWATATLQQQQQQHTPQLRRSLEQRAAQFLAQGSPKEISSVAWACAVLDWPRFLVELANGSDGSVDGFLRRASHHDYSLALWACATVGLHPPPRRLLAALPGQTDQVVTHPLSAAHAAWACATLLLPLSHSVVGENNNNDSSSSIGMQQQQYLGRFFGKINQHADALVNSPQCGTQNVANTIWALATLRLDPPDYVAAANKRAEWLVTHGKPQEISCLLHACATLGYSAPDVFAALDEQLMLQQQHGASGKNTVLRNWNQQDIANAARSYASLGWFENTIENHHHHPGDDGAESSSLDILWRRAIEMFVDEGVVFSDASLSQLAHTRLYAKGYGVSLPPAPDTMLEAIRQATFRISKGNPMSRAAYEISDALREIGFVHEMEVAPDPEMIGGDMLAIDIACMERKIAVECDGPRHYLMAATVDDNDNEYGGRLTLTAKETGSTTSKRRVLQQLGWTVINLDYRDFMRAQNDNNVHDWLRGAMEAAGVEL